MSVFTNVLERLSEKDLEVDGAQVLRAKNSEKGAFSPLW
jgi:hypothetical protein